MTTFVPSFVADRIGGPPPDSAWDSSAKEPLTASSPLATATAVSAILIAEQHDISFSQLRAWNGSEPPAFDTAYQHDLSELIVTSLHWLAQHQNADGGWGDRAPSELATTMLVRAAFQLTGVPVQYANLVERADTFVRSQGGIAGLRAQCSHNKRRIAPILANCAIAGSHSWRQVPALSFGRDCVSPIWSSRLRLSRRQTLFPDALAVGLAKSHHDPARNPGARLARRWARDEALAKLERMQSKNGSFHNSVPTSSFVVMSLASMALAHEPIVRRGVSFLFAALQPDGSWPVAAFRARSGR